MLSDYFFPFSTIYFCAKRFMLGGSALTGLFYCLALRSFRLREFGNSLLVRCFIFVGVVNGASAATVSCGIGQYFDNPAIKFGEISDTVNFH